jgi:hypothetical protein
MRSSAGANVPFRQRQQWPAAGDGAWVALERESMPAEGRNAAAPEWKAAASGPRVRKGLGIIEPAGEGIMVATLRTIPRGVKPLCAPERVRAVSVPSMPRPLSDPSDPAGRLADARQDVVTGRF